MGKKKIGFVLILALLNCSKKEVETQYYKASSQDSKTFAVLSIQKREKDFRGNYQIFYMDKKKDSGAVAGTIFGDTLKGRYDFISRNNSKSLKPVIFLSDNQNLKLGIGDIYTHFNIPFFLESTISYPDSLFQFKPINKVEYEAVKKGFVR